MKKIILFSAIAGAIALLIIFVVPIPYTATEVRITQQPYTVQESYTVDVPYTDRQSYYETVCDTDIDVSASGLIGEVIDIFSGETPFEECYEEIRYRDVQKTRKETRYRDVTKYREVRNEYPISKYATLYQRWIGNVQYWYEIRS